jgi:hypothetical protein
MDTGAEETVGVVVDPEFGQKLREVTARGHVWVVESAANRPIVDGIWAALPKGGLSPVTIFDAVPADAPADTVLRMLDTIELHHPQCTRLEFYGVAVSVPIKQSLADLGFRAIEQNAGGFLARKHAL